MRTVVLFAALAASAGCSNLLGLDDPQLTDAGGGDDDGGNIDAPIDAPPNTVVGRMYSRNTTATGGTVETPVDNSASTIQALIPDATQASGFRVANATLGGADGTFTIAEVPDGETYTLKIGRSYYVTAAHTIDHHGEVPGRADAVNAVSPTPVSFTLTGMQPFFAGPDNLVDSIDLFSFNVGYQGNTNTDTVATSFTQAFDWQDGFGVLGGKPLPEAARSDDLHVFHTRNAYEAGSFGRRIAVGRIVDWYDGGTVTIADGVSNPINGAFSAAPLNRNVALNLTRSAYDSAYSGTAAYSMFVQILAHPVANDFAFGIPLLTLSYEDWSRSTSTTMNLNAMYADPLPASWSRLLYESYQLNRYVKAPTASNPGSIFAGTDRQRLLPSGVVSLTPTLQPPGMVRIEGQDALGGGRVAFDGTAPVTLTWSPVSGAKVYAITVLRIFANGSQTRTQFTGAIFTAASTVDIPAEVFAGGEFFAFTVGAVSAPPDYANGHLIMNGLPNIAARVPTGMFRFSLACGNGTTDTGEQCDATTESTTCDLDCTTRACGDGLRNVAAGEACDTIVDTIACDSDCSLPVCGDNYINNQLEDCDDGNTDDNGNGCGIDCRFSNVCGDGVVQSLAEQCDTGGESATCDRDCTTRACGDGHRNAAAGEQCDFGFNNGGPGCSLTCTTT